MSTTTVSLVKGYPAIAVVVGRSDVPVSRPGNRSFEVPLARPDLLLDWLQQGDHVALQLAFEMAR